MLQILPVILFSNSPSYSLLFSVIQPIILIKILKSYKNHLLLYCNMSEDSIVLKGILLLITKRII